MKKFVISIAAICAALFFVACGDSDGTETAYGVEDNAEEDGQKEENGNKEDGGNGGSTNTDNEQSDSDENTDTEDSNNDEDADTGDNSSDEDTADTADSGEKDCDPNPLYEKFIGRWAAEIILHSVSTASGIEAPSITTRYMLVDFYVNDKCQLDMNKVDNRLCRTDNRTGTDKNLLTKAAKGNVHFNEPDSKFNTNFHHWKPYDIAGQETMPYVEVAENGEGISFKLNQDWELRGADMENPATENMVADANDTRINDTQDENSDPGFTIVFHGSASSGKMYYVQRLHHTFNGELKADDKIQGNVTWNDEQFVIDAESATLKLPKKTNIENDKSIFQFRKVDNAMGCDAMLGQIETIFDLDDPYKDDAIGIE